MKKVLTLAAAAVVTLAACSSTGATMSQAPVAAVTSPSPVPSVQPTPMITPTPIITPDPTPVAPTADAITQADIDAALATRDCPTILAVVVDKDRLSVTTDTTVLANGIAAAGRCLSGTYVDPAPARAASYAKLSDRAWAKIVKSPDSFVGKGYVVWACIHQFDAATGDDHFLADASFKNLGQDYWLNGQNTMFAGDAAKLADFVKDDIVLMNVTSLGSYSYDTQAGGNTTVPSFQVEKITRKGSC